MTKRYDQKDFFKHVVISDIHASPVMADLRAFNTFLAAFAENPCDTLTINGDLLDLAQLMDKGKRVERRKDFVQPTLAEEIDFCVDNVLKPLRKAQPKISFVFKPGNHETRLIRALAGNTEGLRELVQTAYKRKSLDLEDLLHFDDLKIEMSYGEKNGVDFFRLNGGRAAVLHGVKTNKTRMKHYLGFFLCSGTSGHTHKLETEKWPWYGGQYTWAESGCLCRIEDIPYLPEGSDPGWAHGFTTIWQHKVTGETFVKNHPIQNYTLEYHGKVYEA